MKSHTKNVVLKILFFFLMASVIILAAGLAAAPQAEKKAYAAQSRSAAPLNAISLNFSNNSNAVLNLYDGLGRNVFLTGNTYSYNPAQSQWNNAQGNPSWGWALAGETQFIYGPKNFSANCAVFGSGYSYKLPYLVLNTSGGYVSSGALTVSNGSTIYSGNMMSQTSGSAVLYKLYVAIGSVAENFKADAAGRYYFAYTNSGTYYLTDNGFTSNPNDSSIVTNKTIIPVPTAATGLVYNGQTQTGVAAGTGYTVINNTAKDAGNYTASVTANSGYQFANGATTAFVDWSIQAANMANTTVLVSEQTYSGNALTPKPSLVYLGGTPLTENVDYTIGSYSNNVNAGTGKVTLVGKSPNLNGSKVVEFNIKKAAQPNVTFANAAKVSYGGTLALSLSNVKGNASVTYSVVAGTGAGTVKNNVFTPTKAGTVTIQASIAESVNYLSKTVSQIVTVTPKSLAGANVGLPSASYVYTGKAQTPAPSVTAGSVSVPADSYTVQYSANVAVGKVTVTVTGKGNYTGSATASFTIAPCALSAVSAAKIPSVKYDKSAHTPDPTLTYNGMTLKKDVDYTLAWSQNINAGTAKVTVTGKGNYNGSLPLTFIIGKGDQKIDLNGTSLECLASKTLDLAGDLSTGARVWNSSDESVLTVDGNGRITAKKVGSVTVTLTVAGDSNYNEATVRVSVQTTLTNGFYIGDLAGAAHTVYPTLQAAVDAATDGVAVRVKGAPAVGAPVSVTKNVRIEGHDRNAVLSRSQGFTGSLFEVGAGGTLELFDLQIDGKNVAGDPLLKVSRGELIVGAGVAVRNGNAVSGGAIYVENAGRLTVSGGSFTDNVAQNGGAVYVADSAGAVEIQGGSMANNHARELGDAIYMRDCGIVFGGSEATAGITDNLGIGGGAQISVAGELTHKVNVEFSDPFAQVQTGDRFVVSDTLESQTLKEFFRVSNPGYTFQPENAARGGALTLIKSATVVAVVEKDGVYENFYDIQAAIDKAQANGGKVLLARYTNEKDASLNTSEVVLSKTLVVTGKVAFGSIELVAYDNGSGGMDFRYEQTAPVPLKRGASLTGEMIRVEQAGDVTLKNVTLDGGAVWGADGAQKIEVRDDGKRGAGTVVTNNTGVTAHAPVLVNRGKLQIESGTAIQNNDNNYAAPGLGFGSQNYGGGVRNEGAGILTMTGGSIENCYCREGGAIININKPATDGYIENGAPEVIIAGGAIRNNASQMKGAAVQTIYGGANTALSGGIIENNVSLYDLGAVSVEEGGSLFLQGGSVAVGAPNTNAVYVYNRYGEKDYAAAATKPFIEGKGAAQLFVGCSPAIFGNVRLDGPCKVVDTETEYMPFADISGYTGNAMTVDISDPERSRDYGTIAVSSTNNFDKLVIGYPDAISDLGNRYGVTSQNGNKYEFRYGGYDLFVDQTKAGALDITGIFDADAVSVTLTIGGKEFVFPVQNGEMQGTVEFADNGLQSVSNGAKVTVAYAGDSNEKAFATGFYVVYADEAKGSVIAPSGTYYLDGTGAKKTLCDGTLPNDMALDGDGFAQFVVNGKPRRIFIGTRGAEPEQNASAPEKTDFTDTKISLGTKEGFEYNLVDENGTLVFENWAAENIVFENLTPDTRYTVVARTPAAEGKLPSKYISFPSKEIVTLSGSAAQDKTAFEIAFGGMEGKLFDGTTAPNTATSFEIEDVLALYDVLTDDVKELPHITADKSRLDEGLRHALASEWKAAHTEILSTSVQSVKAEDGPAIDAAVAAYDKLPSDARQLLEEEYAHLIALAKKIAVDKIGAAFENSSKSQACADIEAKYIARIEDDSVTVKSEIDLFAERAAAALQVRGEYEKILGESSADMTEQSLRELQTLASDALAALDETAENVEGVKAEAILAMYRKEAEGKIQKYFNDIAAAAGANGITDVSLSKVEEVKDAALADIRNAAADDVKAKPQITFLDLDKAEAKAILDDYLIATDAADIRAVVTDANGRIDSVAANANGEISEIVEETKLRIEKERAKDAAERAASDFPTERGDILNADAAARIDAAADAAEAWIYARRAIAKIELEKARADLLTEISAQDRHAEGKRSAVNETIDEGNAAIDALIGADEIVAEKDAALTAARAALDTFDEKTFEKEHEPILTKELSAIQKDDLGDIDDALRDLAENYIRASQDGMDALRDDLLDKKKAAVTDLLFKTWKDGSSVDGVLDGYAAKIQAVDISQGTDGDALADAELNALKEEGALAAEFETYKNEIIQTLENGRLDGDSEKTAKIISDAKQAIGAVPFEPLDALEARKTKIDASFAKANADALLQRQKDKAKQEFDDCLRAVTGESGGEASKTAHAAIDAANSLAKVNAALGEQVEKAAKSILLAGDSKEVKALADAVAAKIQSAADAATKDDAVAKLTDCVDDLSEDIDALRTREKNAAKNALSEKAQAVFGGELPEEAKVWMEQANNAIESGAFEDYALIESKALAKMEILVLHDALAAESKEHGFTGTESLSEAKDLVIDAIDGAGSLTEISEEKRKGETLLHKNQGAIVLENYIGKDESQFVKDAVISGKTQIDALSDTASQDEIKRIVASAKDGVDAERFQDKNAIFRKPFSKIAADDGDLLQAALDEFASLAAGVREKLDAAARDKNYSDFENLIADARNKAAFEAKKDEVLEDVRALVHGHDGKLVVDVLNRELGRIAQDFIYQNTYDDAAREQAFSELTENIERAFAVSEAHVKFSQKQQRTENQLIADASAKKDSARYNARQQESLDAVVQEAQKKISEILLQSDAGNQAAADAALDAVFSDMKQKLAEVPVSAIATGNIKPDKSPADETGTGDYAGSEEKIWGIVSNDAGMDGSLRLFIEKTDKDSMRQIRNALAEGRVKAAEGSSIAGTDFQALIGGKEIKGALDIYLKRGDVKITEFEGKYIVKVLLTSELRRAENLQVVFVEEDGSVQAYDTKVEDGKYLVFVTAHFSEFYILGEPVLDLWWLIILLSVVLLAEFIVIFALMRKRRQKSVTARSVFPFALLFVLIPEPAIAVCVVLGALVAAAGVAIALLLFRRGKAEEPGAPQAAKSFRQTAETPAKIIPEQTPTVLPRQEVVVRKEVKASEVNELMQDELAASLVLPVSKRSDKTKKGIVNADTLGTLFQAGETVTLDEIKRRVRGFDQKTTYIKILARGSLDKPLVVEADAFSLEAVKMIVLTGGKALKKGDDL